jgi:hypothetical protein
VGEDVGRIRALVGGATSTYGAHQQQEVRLVYTNADAMSPRANARITGVVYLLYFLTALSADVFVGRGRVVLFEAVNFLAYAFYIAVTLRFYYLFRPVNRNLSVLAALFSLLGCANDILGLLDRAPYEISSLVFFGPFCLLIGYLISRSTFLPRTLGVLMMLAGAGWLLFLLPLPNALSTCIKILGFLAEASLMIWLIVRGIDAPQNSAMRPA